MKRQLEFFAADAMVWRQAQQPGRRRRCCPRMPMTRLCLPARTVGARSGHQWCGVITHDSDPRADLALGPRPAGHSVSARPVPASLHMIWLAVTRRVHSPRMNRPHRNTGADGLRPLERDGAGQCPVTHEP